MPQASDELRAEMERRFGDPIDEQGPITFLKNAGYRLMKNWHWAPKPGVSAYGHMSREEFDCLMFLCHEWDFGGLMIDGKEVRS